MSPKTRHPGPITITFIYLSAQNMYVSDGLGAGLSKLLDHVLICKRPAISGQNLYFMLLLLWWSAVKNTPDGAICMRAKIHKTYLFDQIWNGLSNGGCFGLRFR